MSQDNSSSDVQNKTSADLPSTPDLLDLALGPPDNLSENDAWEAALGVSSKPYVSSLFTTTDDPTSSEARDAFLETLAAGVPSSQFISSQSIGYVEPGREERLERRRTLDPLWEQIKLEASHALHPEPQAGPQLYQGILSHPSLIDAIVTLISNEIQTELIPSTQLRNLFMDMLTPEDDRLVHLDVMAAAMRRPSDDTALTAILFNKGLHALVCYRLGHRLWQAGRTGLAYYIQSTVSAKYSADIHPAARIGGGTYLNCGGGVVIGETAVVGEDVSILQGVTLGGTGKEAGDRHPKVGNGVILGDGATVLGNIKVGDGAVVTAKSIVTKPVPELARVSGVPARVKSYRELREIQDEEGEFLEKQIKRKYREQWSKLARGGKRKEGE